MSEIYGKHREQCLDCPSGELETCSIHGPGYPSDECKFLGDFGAKCDKAIPTKDHGNHTVPRDKFNRQQENIAIVNNVVNGIILHDTQKFSAAREAPGFLDCDYNENRLYHYEIMIFE